MGRYEGTDDFLGRRGTPCPWQWSSMLPYRSRWLLNLDRCLVQGACPAPQFRNEVRAQLLPRTRPLRRRMSFRQRRPVPLTTGGLISVRWRNFQSILRLSITDRHELLSGLSSPQFLGRAKCAALDPWNEWPISPRPPRLEACSDCRAGRSNEDARHGLGVAGRVSKATIPYALTTRIAAAR